MPINRLVVHNKETLESLAFSPSLYACERMDSVRGPVGIAVSTVYKVFAQCRIELPYFIVGMDTWRENTLRGRSLVEVDCGDNI